MYVTGYLGLPRSTGMGNRCVIMFAAARGTVRGYTIVVNFLQLPQNETPPQLSLDHIYYKIHAQIVNSLCEWQLISNNSPLNTVCYAQLNSSYLN